MDLVATLERALAGAPPRDPSPDPWPEPWLGWLAVGLCRQRARQSWLVEVHRTRLAGVGADQGDVPGLPGWRFAYHGQGLLLSGPGDEALDYDFHDAAGATIDPFFFAHRVLGLNPMPLPEARLVRWLSGPELLVSGLRALRAAGAIGHPQSQHVVRLAPGLEALHARVAGVDFDAPGVASAWAAHLGDPELAPGRDPGPTQARHRAWLRGLLGDRQVAARVVGEVAEHLDPGELVEAARALLAGPLDAASGRTLEALHALPAGPDAAVLALLDRLDPAAQHPYAPWAALRYLLARGLERPRCLERLQAFAAVERVAGFRGNPYQADLAILALEHDPARALGPVRRALRSAVPLALEDMAALLALLDRPWCRRELVAALRETADAVAARTLAAALLRSADEGARRAGCEGMPPPPERAPDAVGFTWDEVHAANLAQSLEGALRRVRPAAERLRGRLPDDLT